MYPAEFMCLSRLERRLTLSELVRFSYGLSALGQPRTRQKQDDKSLVASNRSASAPIHPSQGGCA